jgi:uncharacterized glyoxalase superfamily protein PhnB
MLTTLSTRARAWQSDVVSAVSPWPSAGSAGRVKNKGPEALGGIPVTIHLYVEDMDKVVAQAVKAGAKVLQPVEDKFYGDLGARASSSKRRWMSRNSG